MRSIIFLPITVTGLLKIIQICIFETTQNVSYLLSVDYTMYRVSQQVSDLVWFDFDLDVPLVMPTC